MASMLTYKNTLKNIKKDSKRQAIIEINPNKNEILVYSSQFYFLIKDNNIKDLESATADFSKLQSKLKKIKSNIDIKDFTRKADILHPEPDGFNTINSVKTDKKWKDGMLLMSKYIVKNKFAHELQYIHLINGAFQSSTVISRSYMPENVPKELGSDEHFYFNSVAIQNIKLLKNDFIRSYKQDQKGNNWLVFYNENNEDNKTKIEIGVLLMKKQKNKDGTEKSSFFSKPIPKEIYTDSMYHTMTVNILDNKSEYRKILTQYVKNHPKFNGKRNIIPLCISNRQFTIDNEPIAQVDALLNETLSALDISYIWDTDIQWAYSENSIIEYYPDLFWIFQKRKERKSKDNDWEESISPSCIR